jgi:hypothetical protein
VTRRKTIRSRLLRSMRAAAGRVLRACVAAGTTCLRTAVRRLRRSGPTVIVDVRRRQARRLRREVARAARTYARALGAELPPRLLVVVQRVVYEGRQLNGLLQAFDTPGGSRRYVLHLALSINGRGRASGRPPPPAGPRPGGRRREAGAERVAGPGGAPRARRGFDRRAAPDTEGRDDGHAQTGGRPPERSAVPVQRIEDDQAS